MDVSRLGDYKGHLTDGEMEQVDMALMKSLSIHPLTQQAKVEPVGPSVADAALAMIALRFLEGFCRSGAAWKSAAVSALACLVRNSADGGVK